MRDKGLDKGLIREFDDSKRDKLGWNKGFFGFRKMFRDYLTKLNVAFYDACCPALTGAIFPVRFNDDTDTLERFNGTTWVAFDDQQSLTATATAFAGGGQGSATQLTAGFTNVTTVATAGDSVKLPAAVAGLSVTVKNNGAANLAVFPATGDTIDGGSANASITLLPGVEKTFVAMDATNWETSQEAFNASFIALSDGTVGALALRLGADANNGLYGISDTQLGIAVEGVLVGGANTTGLFTDSIVEQTTNAGVTIEAVKLEDGGVTNAGDTMFARFTPVAAAQSLSGAGAVNVTSYYTAFTSTGAAQALSLANGTQIGQVKVIAHVVDGGSGVLTPTSLSGGTTITFTTVAETAELIWNGTAWVVLRLYNTAVPGTPPVLA